MVDPYAQPTPSAGMPIAFALVMMLFYAAMLAFCIYLYVRVARKAGYPGWYAALCFVPVVNIVVMFMFCFKEWPIETELRMLRAGYCPGGPGGYPRSAGPAPMQAPRPVQGPPPARPQAPAPQAPQAGWPQTPPQQQQQAEAPVVWGQPMGHPQAPGTTEGQPPSWYNPKS